METINDRSQGTGSIAHVGQALGYLFQGSQGARR